MSPSRLPPEVESTLSSLSPDLRSVADALRDALLDSALALTEGVKWNAPSYTFEGDDRVTFNLRGRGVIRLILHRGAKKRAVPKGRLIDDPDGLLEWAANDRALVSFASVDEVTAQRDALVAIVARWCEAAR